MPKSEIREIIPAPSEAVFDLLHDYQRRLEWDTLLQEAFLEPEFDKAEKGAISVCRGRTFLGGFALRTKYVSFESGKVAAVKMLNNPPFFDKFAVSIRHVDIDNNNSEIIYGVNFTAKPTFLQPILHPIMSKILNWETKKRLWALKKYFAN